MISMVALFQKFYPPNKSFNPFLAKPVIDSLPNSLTLKFKAKSNASPALLQQLWH